MFYLVGMSYAGLYLSFGFWFLLIHSTFVIRQWVYVVFLVLFFFLSFWLCNIRSAFDFLNILFFITLADPFSFLSYFYNRMPLDWSSAESSDMSPYLSVCSRFFMSRGVIAINIICCYCLLFFYFWYSSYRNGFNMSCCFYTKMDFWKSINKSKSFSCRIF